MRKFLLGGFLSGLSAVSLLAATSPIYINNAPLFAPPALPPQIDATAFVNRSTFNVNLGSGLLFIIGDQVVNVGGLFIPPYRMMNTMFVTNAPGATMSGIPGFEFDFFKSTNNARLALDTWENRGIITSDPLIKVMATNIFHRGALEVSEVGLIRLRGTNVDLRRSTLLAGSGANTPPPFGGDITGTNHFNAPGVSDIYWGAGVNNRVTNNAPQTRLDFDGFTNLAQISSPIHQVVRRLGNGLFTNFVTLSAMGMTPFVFTNQVGPNLQYQVVFVPVPTNGAFTTDVRFVPPPLGSPNGGADVIVAIESVGPDILTGGFITNGVYLVDHSAFTTNISVTWTFGTGPLRTRRPDTYEFFRQRPFTWDFGTNANGTFTDTSLYNTNMATNFVDMGYAAYSASFASAATNIVTPPGVPVIPPPGRVEIYGDQVNLDGTRIRADTTVIVKARNLSSNAVAAVDAPFLEFDLGSTSPPLVIRNLAPPTVQRFAGTIQAWSGVWQNMETVSLVDTNGATNTVTTTTDFHVLIVNPAIQAQTPVTVTDLLLAAEQVEIADTMSVARNFRIDARDWTITDTGILSLPSFGHSLGPSNMIDLVNFTNRGQVNISGFAMFRSGTNDTPLANYVIEPGGIFSAAAHDIAAANVQLGGTLRATAGGISISADSVNLSGLLNASSDIVIRSDVVTASNSFITAGSPGAPASIIFDAPGSFTDAGIGEPNEWTAHGGIQVLSLPGTGDLLGTKVIVPLPNFGEALIRWPAADFGASPGGFGNNLALGTLAFSGTTNSLLRFESVQEPGAIYIGRLEITGGAENDASRSIEIEPGMTVYFADSSVDPTILDGLHGGRLRWVQGFAGPLNSTNIVYPSGETYTLNAALVRSTTLDSDGDGIVNALDSTPVIVGDRIDLKIACSRSSATRRTVISWMAPANSTSIVEYKDSLHATTWQALPALENTGAAQLLSVSQDLPAAASQRFYRVRTE